MESHVTSSYLDWLDDTLPDREAVERHLAACEACRIYYAKMNGLLKERGTALPRLEPDPALPARIRAGAVRLSAASARVRGPLTVRWPVAGLAGALALLAGIMLGIELHHGAAGGEGKSSTDVSGAYYNAVSQQDFTAGLESLLQSAPKEKP